MSLLREEPIETKLFGRIVNVGVELNGRREQGEVLARRHLNSASVVECQNRVTLRSSSPMKPLVFEPGSC